MNSVKRIVVAVATGSVVVLVFGNILWGFAAVGAIMALTYKPNPE